MNRFTSGLFVGLQASMSSLAISQRTDIAENLPLSNYIYDGGLNFDRGSGRIGSGC
ncbi:hypothetical protein BMF81_04125 [Nodularia spumigena UHCC 0039]|jgi:hypothetical protein|uniref:Uncharacterized protein n=1 Tax=Nodularia spumigena UHCC 0039 TaxID=1914872 RepID=A0A2S0QAM0_NODSP|nr:hypothetical protein BMF81_04125 [Nodularia spumigena UHCC 0039]